MTKSTGTLRELGQQMTISFRRLTPERQARVRRAMYEHVTKTPFRSRKP